MFQTFSASYKAQKKMRQYEFKETSKLKNPNDYNF